MPLEISIDAAREERIGGHGVAADAFAETLAQSGEALAQLRSRHDDGSLPLLRLPAARQDIAAILQAARRIAANATDVVFLGTGGSSLGGQTLAQLAGHAASGWVPLRGEARLHFMDNLDADSFTALLARLPLTTARFVAISKSGGTGETLMQVSAVISALEQAGLKPQIPQMLLGLSEPQKPGKRNGLRALLDAHGAAALEHDPDVGGRFSVLTNVGLLPAAIAGLDVAAVRAGAAAALAPILEGRPPAEVPSAVGAALSVALARTRGKQIAVLMAYADRL
jgi:glucose-6-phosphate isomerase